METILTADERSAIRAVAAGNKEKFSEARAAFDRAAQVHGVDACVELQFMAEVLAPTPDLLLRRRYREALLNQPV
ncbi:hypothetical protein [Burkholderia cepacia]|uniref:hypothetical protein n=1 Tax=Burkholderia cepacia TaxID=292 RepID=UPI002AB7764C|nr:hypothetical protein [Burkholderia cepacia]